MFFALIGGRGSSYAEVWVGGEITEKFTVEHLRRVFVEKGAAIRDALALAETPTCKELLFQVTATPESLAKLKEKAEWGECARFETFESLLLGIKTFRF